MKSIFHDRAWLIWWTLIVSIEILAGPLIIYFTRDKLRDDSPKEIAVDLGNGAEIRVTSNEPSKYIVVDGTDRLRLLLNLVTSPSPVRPLDESCVVKLKNDISIEFILVKAGSFVMGSPNDEPGREAFEHEHDVTITHAYYLSSFEVTRKQYSSLMNKDPSVFQKGDLVVLEDLPVEGVTWYEAKEFCRTLTKLWVPHNPQWEFDLPTEAEWEYACRAGATIPQCWSIGNAIDLKKINYSGETTTFPVKNKDGEPQKDKTFVLKSVTDLKAFGRPLRREEELISNAKNAWGFFAMPGNVSEWCLDWWEPQFYLNAAASKDPVGPLHGEQRVWRGGSFADPPEKCRNAYRGREFPTTRSIKIGFRLCLRVNQDK